MTQINALPLIRSRRNGRALCRHALSLAAAIIGPVATFTAGSLWIEYDVLADMPAQVAIPVRDALRMEVALAVATGWLGCVLVARTVRRIRSDQARPEEERLRLVAEHMEALGHLAGGIAHDFNNVLQAVQSGSSLILERPGDVSEVRRIADIIEKASERGAAITSRLLTFARQSDLTAVAIDTARFLRDMGDMLRHTLGTGIEVRLDLPDEPLPPLFADKQQLATVLINLATNARDAMNNLGVLTLAARVRNGEEVISKRFTLKPGHYICLTVTDNGCGMSEAVMNRVFEPLFTTKPQGRGTGLGLSMAHRFAEQSGGGVDITSRLSTGTTVMLYVPLSKSQPIAEGRISPAGEVKRRTIILVDDDEMVREMIEDQLVLGGFEVYAFDGGQEALDALDDGLHADAMVADLSMPHMDGIMLIKEAQARQVNLPAILLSGFATDDVRDRGLDEVRATTLRKPVTGKELTAHLHSVINAAG
jgi:signal transduction histidine kinase